MPFGLSDGLALSVANVTVEPQAFSNFTGLMSGIILVRMYFFDWQRRDLNQRPRAYKGQLRYRYRKPTLNYCVLFLIASITERRTPIPMKE